MFEVSDGWKAAFPGVFAGVLAMRNVANPAHCGDLNMVKQALQDRLRDRFSDGDRRAIEALAPIQAYNAYYKRFKKSYHVQLQLESIVFKGKSIPSVAALVEAMFIAEIKNLLLTAGHDLDIVRLPATLNVSAGNELYTLLRGEEQVLKPGDMMISDGEGVISSVLYGPDQRTQIRPSTEHVLFTVYAPPGIEEQAVHQHLQDIRSNVLIVSPDAEVELLQVFGTW
jgi:DNA/RNA-binding domain of Phe-tRNA-synthetase-like protein